MKRAVFFDRDDTLVVNVPYNGDPDKVQLLPGAAEACRRLRELGFRLFIISNQSGVGRGIITVEQVAAVNRRLLSLLGKELFDDIYCCYDDPAQPVEKCRKPSPAMLLKAARDHHLDLPSSFMIGDREEDVLAGRAAGCRTIRLFHQQEAPQTSADFAARSLTEAADWIARCIEKDDSGPR